MATKIAAAVIAAFTAAAFAVPTTANAKLKQRIHHRVIQVVNFIDPRPPLTVDQRSWLDPGPVVPQGSMEHYVEANTILNLTPDQMYTGRLGNETLPRRFELPARQDPLVEFWTPRD
jgi:hypothetical protein